jgi:hypothetical protein
MNWIRTYSLLATAFSVSCLVPETGFANASFTYSSADINVAFTLAGPTVDIPANTDVTTNVSAFSMMYPSPATDLGGTANNGSEILNPEVQIGTDSSGAITSWNISVKQIALFATSSCVYNVSFATAGAGGTLVLDQDMGKCPSTDSATETGSWTTTALPVRLQSFDVE